MEVYEYDKCLLDRLEESLSVLSWKEDMIPASQVRQEWSYFIELQIEPTGWQALWKIPRVICEELDIRFPTIVFGAVEQVLFKELKAIFFILAVQDDVHLPERHEVLLEDLWPTLSQENNELNVERTADCIDRLRFFYTQVWLPWDDESDDDLNWVENHLEFRIRLCYDIRKGNIKRPLIKHIRALLSEAKYIKERRSYLELGIGDNENSLENADKSQITDLMRLHLRLHMIKNEIEMFENTELRHIYEEIKFENDKHLKVVEHGPLKGTIVCNYVVILPCMLEESIEILHNAQKRFSKHTVIQMNPSLQDVLNKCNASDNIYLSPGKHQITFLENLNGNGSITGIKDKEDVNTVTDRNAIIFSSEDNRFLLEFDGDYTMNNLVFDCENIRTGIVVKSGKILLKNCRLIGDKKSSTQQGIVCFRDTNVTLENCVIEHFSIGIILNEGSKVSFKDTTILKCAIGIDLNATNTNVYLERTKISTCTKCGINVDSISLPNEDSKFLVLDNFKDIKLYESKNFICSGDCSFDACNKANIYILNQKKSPVSLKAMRNILGIESALNSQIIKCVDNCDDNVEDNDKNIL